MRNGIHNVDIGEARLGGDQPVAREIGGAQSVDRALALLSLISRHAGGVSLSTVVEESGLNRATARRLLLALMRSRLVEQEPVSRRYHLGEEAFVLGVLASRRYGLLDVAMESLIALSARSGDTSFLSVRRDARPSATRVLMLSVSDCTRTPSRVASSAGVTAPERDTSVSTCS